MYKYAIIVAGGSGRRMGTDIPKQFLLLNGKPVLWYSVKAFTDTYSDIEIILALPSNYFAEGEVIAKEFPTHKISIVTGGDTRFHSVKNGLQAVTQESIVFIHDAVRCLLTSSLILRCFATTLDKGNGIAAVTATDTIRIETPGGNQQLDRNNIRIIQTPQTFRSNTILKAFQQEYSESFTDEASVAESAGEKIFLVEGETTNIKITRPIDLMVAERILQERANGQ